MLSRNEKLLVGLTVMIFFGFAYVISGRQHDMQQQLAALSLSIKRRAEPAIRLADSGVEKQLVELKAAVLNLSKVKGTPAPPAAPSNPEIIAAVASIQEQVKKLSNHFSTSDLKPAIARIDEQVKALSKQVTKLIDETPVAEEVILELHTKADAESLIAKLIKPVSSESLADALATIDSWAVKPDDEKGVSAYKVQQIKALRRMVKVDVERLQKLALEADKGKDSIRLHAEAGRILSLYPMAEEKDVMDEAKQLAGQQAEAANRIETIRRQRYNHWATERIEAAINGYNENASYLNPKKENPKLIESLVASLGEVEPLLMEPVVLDLYHYAIGLTKSSISEADKVELSKRLSDRRMKRKTMGDF